MSHPLLTKIARFTQLPATESAEVADALALRTSTFAVRRDLMREGETPRRIFVIVQGWACRYRTLPDGRRQITAFLFPGDLCDSHAFVLASLDHSIGTLSPLTASELLEHEVLALTASCPGFARALWWDTLVQTAIQREWTISVGRRDAAERVAHLFMEMLLRHRAVGLAEEDGFEMPATQSDLADALGITTVHTNRTLQALRASGMISLERKRLVVHDVDKLRRLAMFDGRYLHLDREARQLWSAA